MTRARRVRHRRLVHIACALYGATCWLYPSEFRRRFSHELRLTFRNRVEDVLDREPVAAWFAFAFHIVWDTLRASTTMATIGDRPASTSVLGLVEGAVARGGIAGVSLDIELLFTVAGLLLALGGWYGYFVVLPSYMS